MGGSDDSAHIERFAELASPIFADERFAMDRRSRGSLLRSESRMGDQMLDGLEALDVDNLRQQASRCQFRDPWLLSDNYSGSSPI